jgi:hypothetical protein
MSLLEALRGEPAVESILGIDRRLPDLGLPKVECAGMTPHANGYRGVMGTALFLLLWWVALFGWWIVLAGTNSGLELIAGACAGLLGALLALAVRRSGLLRYRFEARWPAKTLKVPWQVLYETGAVFWALALNLVGLRRLSSRYQAFDFPAGRNDPTSRGRRAVAVAADSIGPNASPVDIDCERDVALRHELDPKRSSNSMP